MIACANIAAANAREASNSHSLLALVGGTIYANPASPALTDGAIAFQDGVITAIGPRSKVHIEPDTTIIDCKGLVITAGLWNSHVHFAERKWSDAETAPAQDLERQLTEMFLQYGFTSAYDLSSDLENTLSLRNRIDSGEISGPRILTTGEGLIAPGAAPPSIVTQMMGWMIVNLLEVSDAETASAATARLINSGADGVKLFAATPQANRRLETGTIDGAVAVAHSHGKPVFLHPSSSEDVVDAVSRGVDVITHTTPNSQQWDAPSLSKIRSKHVALTPTLSLWRNYQRHDRVSMRDGVTTSALDQLSEWVAFGGVVLFGTDAGANEYDPSEEYSLMAKAGMTSREILASLTSLPAEFFGSARLGKIEVGNEADLAVFGGDPIRDISEFTNVRYVVRSGNLIYQRRNDKRIPIADDSGEERHGKD
jgi:imidazolonepropionase-like amidohydrolase